MIPTNHPINRPTIEPTNQPTNQPVSQSASHNPPIYQPTNHCKTLSKRSHMYDTYKYQNQ